MRTSSWTPSIVPKWADQTVRTIAERSGTKAKPRTKKPPLGDSGWRATMLRLL